MSDARLTALETLTTHQEKKIEELSEMVTQQWAIIERLKAQINLAQDRLAGIEDRAKDAKSEDGLSIAEIAALNKPPHY